MMSSPTEPPPASRPRDVEGRPKDRSVVAVAPMMLAALGVLAGVVADRAGVGMGTAGWAAVAAAGAVGAAARGWGEKAGAMVAAVVAFVGFGGARHHAHWTDLGPDDLARAVRPGDEARPAWLKGVIVETPTYRPDRDRPGGDGSTRTRLEVSGWSDGRDWHRASGTVAVWIGGDRTDLEPGRPVQLAGDLGPIEGPLNPGERDPRESSRAEGVRLRVAVGSTNGVWADPDGAVDLGELWLGRLRAWSHRRLVEGLDPGVAPLASALLLGRREAVDPDLNDAFARTGTTHLLAISGLHLQALAALIGLVALVAGLGLRRSLWAVMIGSTGYAVLVGLAPSVARSLVMTLAVCVAGLLDRSPRPANLLATAAFVMVLVNPSHPFDAGGQLSFLAVGAIFWGMPAVLRRLRPELDPLDRVERHYEPAWRRRTRRAAGWLAEGVAVSTLVWLAAWPLVALRFHVSSPIGILLNIPLVPITSMAMLAAGLSLGLAAIWAPLGLPAAWACRWLLVATDGVVRWGADRSWGHWFGPGPPGWAVVGFYGLLALGTAAGLNRWGKVPTRLAWSSLAGVVAWMLAGPWLPTARKPPEAEVMAVGHGLAVLVRSGDGRALLYDAGRMGDPRIGRRVIAPGLWARGVRRLDTLVLSHADADHFNGLPDLLDRVPIGAVLVAPGFVGDDNPSAVALLDRVRSRGVPIREVSRGESWGLGRDVRLAVLHPTAARPPGSKDNARSVVLAVESGGRTLLLTGDLEGAGLTDLTARAAPSIDAFLAPHHGGRTSNPTWLYDWAQPGMVVVSQRRPSPGTRDALEPIEAADVPVLRTWRRGAVRLRWTPGDLVADGFLDEAHPPERSTGNP